MVSKRVRVGIVGANADRGWAKDAHVPALRRLSDTYLIAAVSARDQELAERARVAFGAERAFGDSLALARDPDIDLVSVTVKVPEHRAVVLAALEAGKHVYCEWPLGRDVAESNEMAAAVRPGSHVMVGLQGLCAPAVCHARQLVRSGVIGRPKILRGFSPTAGWSEEVPPFYTYLQDRRNGATLETIAGGHTLAVLESIVGPYVELDARTSILLKQVRVSGTDETVERTSADHMLIQGLHEGGCVSTLEVIGGVVSSPFKLELVGEKGWIKISGGGPGGFQVGALSIETSFASEPMPPQAVHDLAGPPANVAEMYMRLAADIHAGMHTVSDFNDAVRLSRLLDAIDRASATGQRQQLVPAT